MLRRKKCNTEKGVNKISGEQEASKYWMTGQRRPPLRKELLWKDLEVEGGRNKAWRHLRGENSRKGNGKHRDLEVGVCLSKENYSTEMMRGGDAQRRGIYLECWAKASMRRRSMSWRRKWKQDFYLGYDCVLFRISVSQSDCFPSLELIPENQPTTVVANPSIFLLPWASNRILL